MTASGSTELSDSVDLSLSESEEESSLPSTSCFVSHNMPLISESHFINKRITGIIDDNKRIIGSPIWHKRIE